MSTAGKGTPARGLGPRVTKLQPGSPPSSRVPPAGGSGRSSVRWGVR